MSRKNVITSSAPLKAVNHQPLLALLLMALLVPLHGAEPTIEQEVATAVIWLGGMSPARVGYETQVVELALEKSRDRYGDYTYTINDAPLTSQRVERDIRDGTELNLISHPVWLPDPGETTAVKIIPVPIAHGLLGYRQFIVRAEDLPRFRTVETRENLQQLTAGLGADWVDQQVFEQNKLPWQSGKTTEQLLLMLARGRFDYLPLGAIEVEDVLAGSAYREQLAVVPDLVLYYPLPVYLQVSINRPRLAERLEFGLRQAQKDGTLEALFNTHYGRVLNLLRAAQPRVIALQNDYLPDFTNDPGPLLLQN